MTQQPSFFGRLARFGAMLATAAALAACGGGGGSSSSSASTNSGASSGASNTTANQVQVMVAQGVAGVINSPTVSVTICAPGSTTNCQTINNVLLDTGSYGLRVLASAASGVLGSLPTTAAAGGGVLAECGQFVNTYTWGSVRKADVRLSGEVASSVPIQIISDSSVPSTPPSSCSTNGGTQVSTAAALGANGLLGIGAALADCGATCTSAVAEAAVGGQSSTYFGCQGSTCSLAGVPESQQVQNVAANFATDNNGMVLTLGNPSGGTASGTLTFGVNTQANNTLASTAPHLTTDSAGDMTATLDGTSYTTAFFDTGSNGLYFNAPSAAASSLPACSSTPSFYCPTSTQTLTGTVTGQNGVQQAVSLSIMNASTEFASNGYALPDLGGKFGTSGVLDFGLPFFFGRTTYFGFDLSASTGAVPYISF